MKNSIKPDIYECKICGEHHCEHDTTEFHSAQEMQAIYQPKNNVVIQPMQQSGLRLAKNNVNNNGINRLWPDDIPTPVANIAKKKNEFNWTYVLNHL